MAESSSVGLYPLSWKLRRINYVSAVVKVQRFDVLMIALVHLGLYPAEYCVRETWETTELISAWKVNDRTNAAFAVRDNDGDVVDERGDRILCLVFVRNRLVAIVEKALMQVA